MKQQHCQRCKTPLNATAAYCTSCGCQIAMQKKATGKIIGIIAAVLVLVLIAGFSVFFLINRSTSPSVYDQYVSTMRQLKEKGDNYTENGMVLQAEYCYGVAGSSISAFRFAIDNLISIKGENDNLSEVVGDAYGDWDTIAAINYASPYSYYFEGLIHQIRDEEKEAKECYKNALTNPSFPEKGLSFHYLNDLSIKELSELKAELASMEENIYSSYTPDISSCPRDPMNFNDAYLRALAKEVLEQDEADYGAAHQYYITALKVNPFEPKNFACLALLAIYTEDADSAFYYTNEGLWIDEEDEALNQIRALLQGEEAGET